MDDTERRSAKRSRFDQTEPKRTSRFDRRSRSPPVSKPEAESRRSRSPLPRVSDSPATDSAKKGGADPAAAAAAAAARINAQIQAKKGIQHVDVPPIRSILSPSGPKSASPGATSSGNSAALVNGEMYIADGDYIRDIEVNDLRNRYTLTKGSTQKMVNTPCVNIPLIHQAFFTRYSFCHIPISFYIHTSKAIFCVGFSSLPRSASIYYTTLFGIC